MKLHAKYSSDGLVIVGAATDSQLMTDTPKDQERGDVGNLAEALRIPYPVTIADQGLIEHYKFIGIPTIVFITSEGKIAKIFYGYHSAQQIEQIVRQLLLQK